MRSGYRRAGWLLTLVWLGCGPAELSDTEAGVAVSASADAFCQTLGEDESLIGVSPEGEAWVDGEDGVRHVLPDGTITLVDADFTRPDVLVAWDAAAAFVVGDNSLWSTTFAGAQPLSLPPELGKPRFVCGDPERSSGAFVITTRGLFEKNNDTWLRWPFPVELLDSMQIRDLQGACSGQDPVMYLEAGSSLWEVRYGERASLHEVAELDGASAVGPDVRIGFIALREGELLRFDGSGWAPIPFDEGAVTAADAADGVLWAAVDGTLYRRNRFDEWEYIDAPMWPTTISEIHGYAAGGAWLVRTNELCHVQARETIRVDGVRLYGRLPEGSGFQVAVSGDPAMGSSLSARLDGQGVQVSGAAGAWLLSGPETLSPGWHTLSLHVASSEGPVERSVKFLVEGGDSPEPPMPEPPGEPTVTWEEDIRPLYERSCSPCHGEGGNNTFMGSFEAFSALGELALSRVSSGEMPPPAASAVAEPLSSEEVELLRTWVQEGMNPVSWSKNTIAGLCFALLSSVAALGCSSDSSPYVDPRSIVSPEDVPETKRIRRLTADQFFASLNVATGQRWDDEEQFAATLGRPDFAEVTAEGREMSVGFAKLAGDAARQTCRRAVEQDLGVADPSERVILRKLASVDPLDPFDPGAGENLRYLTLRFLGVHLVDELDHRLDPWLRLLQDGLLPEDEARFGEATDRWIAVCTGLALHPDFLTY